MSHSWSEEHRQVPDAAQQAEGAAEEATDEEAEEATDEAKEEASKKAEEATDEAKEEASKKAEDAEGAANQATWQCWIEVSCPLPYPRYQSMFLWDVVVISEVRESDFCYQDLGTGSIRAVNLLLCTEANEGKAAWDFMLKPPWKPVQHLWSLSVLLFAMSNKTVLKKACEVLFGWWVWEIKRQSFVEISQPAQNLRTLIAYESCINLKRILCVERSWSEKLRVSMLTWGISGGRTQRGGQGGGVRLGKGSRAVSESPIYQES